MRRTLQCPIRTTTWCAFIVFTYCSYDGLGQIRTNGTLISPSTSSHNIFIGDNALTPIPGPNKAKLEVRGEQLFTSSNWSAALRLISKNEGSMPQNGAALIWDKGSIASNPAPYHFFMAGPADNPRGDFFTGWVSDYGNANNNPIYSSSVYSAVRNNVNPIGTVRFYKNVIIYDGVSPETNSTNRLGLGLAAPTEQLHTNKGVRFEGLTESNSASRMVMTDATGKLFFRNYNAFAMNGCSKGNVIPKVDPSNSNLLTCSQLYDNGTNVGLNTTSPNAKFHLHGGSIWMTGGSLTSILSGTGLRMFSDQSSGKGHIFSHNYSSGSGTDLIFQTTGGNVGISTNPGIWTGSGNMVGSAPPVSSPIKLDVNGTFRSTYILLLSDARLKSNIKPLEHSLEKVMKLRGVSYSWNKTFDKGLNLDDLPQIGFLAQEVEPVIPEAVGTDEKGIYGMNYQAIIPVLVGAIQEQQHMIQKLQEQLAQSRPNLNVEEGEKEGNEVGKEGFALAQNRPNPFGKETIISYTLPETDQQCSISIFDLNSVQVMHVPLKTKGKGELVIRAHNLKPGTYVYSLLVDGNTIVSRKMVITE